MSTESSPLRSIPWKSLGSIGVLIAAAALMYVFTPQGGEQAGPDGNGVQTIDAQLRAEKELERVLFGMQPGRLDSLQDRLAATDDLNRWAVDFPQSAEKPLTADDELLKRLLAPNVYANVVSDRFLPTDAAHLRMSLLASSAVAEITAKHPPKPDQSEADHEAELVTAVFDFIWRNVAEDEQQKPFTPYDILMLGRGTSSDRIWCFAEFVRQLELETVLIVPASPELSAAVLLGVVASNKEVLLFEPTLGIPVYAPETATTHLRPQRPVTFQEARQNPEILTQFNFTAVPQLGLPQTEYPLTADVLNDIKVLIVVNQSQLSPRMAYVEFRLPAALAANVYAGLGANSLREIGIYDRVLAAGEHHQSWTADDIAVWPSPFALDQANEEMRADPNSEFSNLARIMSGPMVPTPDGSELRPADKTLEEVRVEQISGQYATALSHLLPIRNANHRVPMPVNKFAADFATYRAAQCQMQLGQFESAEKTLTAYLSDPQGGQLWGQEAIESLAWLRMQAVHEADIETAANLPSPFAALTSVPRASLRNLFWMHRWFRMLQAQGKLPVNETPASTPTAEPASASPSNALPPAPPLPEHFPLP